MHAIRLIDAQTIKSSKFTTIDHDNTHQSRATDIYRDFRDNPQRSQKTYVSTALTFAFASETARIPYPLPIEPKQPWSVK